MAKKAIKYCFREPKFPVHGFMGMIPILDDDKELFTIFPTSLIYKEMNQFLNQINQTMLALQKRNITIAQICPLVSLTLMKTVPLKREYWQKPQIHLSETERCGLFHRVLLFPQLHTILATPGGQEKQCDLIQATIPLTKPTADSIIEQFMRLTDFPVDQTAKLAAVYNIENIMAINITNGEFTKVPELLATTSNHN